MYEQGSQRHFERAVLSARLVTDALSVLPIKSVADFGCGKGAWLNAWSAKGAEVVGLDGAWTQGFRADPKWFHLADLSAPVDLGRKSDLAQSLEVAEHLPASAADAFVSTLTRHADVVLFSAAPPFQGGEGHINEQPYEYWREKFAACGYRMFDFVRPRLVGTGASDWYKCNTFLYVKTGTPMPDAIASTLVSTELRDFASMKWKLRKLIVRFLLPKFTWNLIAQRKYSGAR